MDFALTDDKDQKYAVLYPTFQENSVLKEAGQSLGREDIVKFARVNGNVEWRLYEDRIPAGTDIDATFGKFATPEAKAAAEAERAAFLEKNAAAKAVTAAPEIPESQRYYAPEAEGHRKDFNALRKETGTEIVYNKDVGAFVHKSGPVEAFAKYQTPEMKALWEAEAPTKDKVTKDIAAKAPAAMEVITARAEGKHFLADNAQGFMLPRKHEVDKDDPTLNKAGEKLTADQLASNAAHAAQLGKMKGATDGEVAQVHTVTKNVLRELENKELRIRMAVAGKTEGFNADAFIKLPRDEQRAAAGNAGLKGVEFAKMVSVKNGFFAIRQEALDRGIIPGLAKTGEEKSAAKGSDSIGAGLKPKAQEQAPAAAKPTTAQKRARQAAAAMGNSIDK